MSEKTIGVSISGDDALTALAEIRRAERLGVKAAWLTSGGGGGDALTLFAVAASETERILLGTSIVQTWSRHPVAMAQQAQVIANIAPERFRLGIGPSGSQGMQTTYGANFRKPLGHLREYLQILKGLLQVGSIDMDGEYYTAHAKIPMPLNVPVMASALRTGAFELCGAESDGAISWVCPHDYLRDVALPAMRKGAESANRSTPPMIVHAALCVDEDRDAARDAVRDRLGYFPRAPFYARMFESAGFPDSAETGWTDEMVDSVLISGNEDSAEARLRELFDWGASEVFATIVTVGDAVKSSERSMKLIAQVSST